MNVHSGSGRGSETVNLAILLLHDADLAQELLDMLPLVARQLDDLSVLGVLDDRPVAVVLLKKENSIVLAFLRYFSAFSREHLKSSLTTEGKRTFLRYLTIFLRSYSGAMPCTVVIVLRPVRC